MSSSSSSHETLQDDLSALVFDPFVHKTIKILFLLASLCSQPMPCKINDLPPPWMQYCWPALDMWLAALVIDSSRITQLEETPTSTGCTEWQRWSGMPLRTVRDVKLATLEWNASGCSMGLESNDTAGGDTAGEVTVYTAGSAGDAAGVQMT